MKRVKIIALCMCAVLLAGCENVMPNMTDEQSNMIGEYAAITLLRYDANSRSRLVDLSKVEDKPEPVVPETPSQPVEEDTPETQQDTTPVVDNTETGVNTVDSMEAFLEFAEGIKLSCTGYEFCDSYQEGENSYFALEATEGKELLVLKFSIQNSSGTDVEINLFDREDSYRVTLNGSYTRAALTTMLSSDLKTYKEVVSAGGTNEAVLVFEVDPEQAADVSSIDLSLKNATETYTVSVM